MTENDIAERDPSHSDLDHTLSLCRRLLTGFAISDGKLEYALQESLGDATLELYELRLRSVNFIELLSAVDDLFRNQVGYVRDYGPTFGSEATQRLRDLYKKPHHILPEEDMKTFYDEDAVFTRRELDLINNCLNYVENDPTGLPGHNLMIIVAKLWGLADQATRSFNSSEHHDLVTRCGGANDNS